MDVSNKKCFNCGSSSNIHQHHPIPRVLGGTATIPLCEACHGAIHGLDFRNHSALTKAGLQKAKERGVKLGNPQNLSNHKTGMVNSRKIRTEKANKFAIEVYEIIKSIEGNYSQIARELNSRGFKTARGSEWASMTVKRIIDRVNKINKE